MDEMALGVEASSCIHRLGDERTRRLITAWAGARPSLGAGPSTDLPEPGVTREANGRCSRTAHRRGGKGMRILIASLVGLLVVYFVTGIDPRLLGIDLNDDPPIDRCVTEQSVLRFLDGKTVLSASLTNTGTGGVETITLRKERISSLRIESDGMGSIVLRFNLNDGRPQYPVEASFVLTTSDSPELHYHGWVHFMGAVVPRP